MAWRIDQIDQEFVFSKKRLVILYDRKLGCLHTLRLLFDGMHVLVVDSEVHGDGSRFDGDTTLLFVRSRICKWSLTHFFGCDDTSF